MVMPPKLIVRAESAERCILSGLHADRAATYARHAMRHLGLNEELKCAITVVESLPNHAGLGSGTQLALGIGAAVFAWVGKTIPPANQLALAVGRSSRSTVGTYGFDLGGLIFEGGKANASIHSPLLHRAELPSDWRFVLVRPPAKMGLFGQAEIDAFARLPPVPASVTERLSRIVTGDILPATEDTCFDRFSAALYEYGVLAGTCFSAIQGGPFQSPAVEALIARIREFGIAGVGQSSWGPTVYAVAQDEPQAHKLAEYLLREPGIANASILIAAPVNHGASIQISP